MRCSESSPRRDVLSDAGLPKETRKISDHLTYYLQELDKEQIKSKVSRKEEIKRYLKSNRKDKLRAGFLKRNKNQRISSQAHHGEKRENPNKQNRK